MGAAYLAGLAVDYWKDLEEIRSNWAVDRGFEPQISAEVRSDRLAHWAKAVACASGWAKS